MPVFPNRPNEGVPATGAAIVLTTASFGGALLDLVLSGHLGIWFDAAFLLGSGWTGARLIRRDMLTSLVTPPLVFGLVTFVAAQFVSEGAGVSNFLVNQLMNLGGALGSGAPVLFSGLGLAGGLAAVRLLGSRAVQTATPMGPARPAGVSLSRNAPAPSASPGPPPPLAPRPSPEAATPAAAATSAHVA